MSVSRRQFLKHANPNADKFCCELSHTEASDPSIIWLAISSWDEYKFIQFSTFCRLLFNFGLKRIILIINNNTNEFSTISNSITDSILKDPFFVSLSRIKQPKSMIIMHCISQKHLKLYPHHLLNKFSVAENDKHKLQILLIHSNSISFASLSCSSTLSRVYYQPFMYHNLCNIHSFKSQLNAIHNLGDKLCCNQNKNLSLFHMELNDKPIATQSPSLSFISFATFTLYSYRLHVPLMDETKSCLEMKQSDATNNNISYECIPVLFEWKDPYNIGRIIQLCKLFNIKVFIHLFDYQKLNLYQNLSFVTKIMDGCRVQNMDKWKSMICIKVIHNEDIDTALKIINNVKHSNESRVFVLVMNSESYLKLLRLDQERDLLIMETVKFGNKMLPIALNKWIKQQRNASHRSTSYGIVGRENYGIKPKYLYDLYKIYDTEKNKECQVVYVETSKMLPSLNACTAMSLLIWAHDWLDLGRYLST